MATSQGLFTGGVKIRNLNGYLIAVNGEVYATTNTGGTTVSFFYQAKTGITSGDPGSGHLLWNNATQTSATQLNVSHLTDTPIEDIDLYLSAIVSGNKLIVQDRNDSERFQIWTVSGTPTQVGLSYWTIPVTLTQSAGAAFTNNHDLLFAIVTNSSGGGGTTTNSITFNNSGSGAASGTSFNGGVSQTISYNTIGAQAASGSLTSLANLSYASGTPFVKMTAAGTFALDTNNYLTANQTITLSGDGSGSGTTAITFTLATVNSNVGTFNNVTVNAKGLVTSASNVSYQTLNANLTSLAGLSFASTSFVKMTGANTFTLDTNTYLTANQTITLSGNVTGSGTTSITTTIANNVVTNAMLAQIATARIRGRVTAGTGNVEDLTGTQATTLLDSFAGSAKGLVPVSVGGTTNFLRADGAWAAPPGGGGGSPAGSNTQIQYNNGGAFGASANLTWDGNNLTVLSGNTNGIVINCTNTGSPADQTRLSWKHNGGDRGLFYYSESGQTFSFQSSGVTRKLQIASEAGVGFYMTGSNTNVRIGDSTAANAPLSVAGTTLINTNTDNGVDKLQVNGSASISNTLNVTSGGIRLGTAGNGVSLSCYLGGSTDAYPLVNNAYVIPSVGWKYLDNGPASIISYESGDFIYSNSPTNSSGAGTFLPSITSRMRITAAGNMGVGSYTAPAARLVVDGTALINTNTDNGVDKLQVNGSILGSSIKRSGGTSSQVLYADGSVKQITSGTAAPSGGNDGDIYLQYI